MLEMSGLSPYADFTEQNSSETEKGRIRPDVIVRMPGGRELVINSKVSLDDYLAASNESDPAKRQAFLAAHAAKVRAHVTNLARKDYWKGFSDRVDFVAMFMPGENFYAAVLEHDREIFDFASRNSVIIVTPSTLSRSPRPSPMAGARSRRLAMPSRRWSWAGNSTSACP